VLTSVLPVVTSTAAIPAQTVTLTFSPVWTVTLFAAALVFACGALWMLRNVEIRSRKQARSRVPVTLPFPRPGRPVAVHRAA
jgi:hypothetical protein